MLKRIALCAALLLTFAVHAVAQISAVPTQMTFQGRLAKPDGTPVADTTAASLTFRLYTASTGGTLLWSQTVNSVAVHNGAFSVRLNFASGFASGQNLTTAFNNAPYLEIQVAPASSPLTPRQPLTTNAFAFKAGSVADGSVGLNGLASGVLNFSNIGGTLNFSSLSGQITSAQIANGAVGLTQLDPSIASSLQYFGYGPEYLSTIPVTNGPSLIAASNGYLYLMSGSTSSPYALNIYNTTNPSVPQRIATLPTYVNSYAITASGNYVYILSVSVSGTVHTAQMQIVDVSNPAAPVIRSSYGFPGDFYAAGIAVTGNFACVTNYSGNALQILNIGNPAAPSLVGSAGTDAGPNKLAAFGNYVYVVNSAGNTLETFSLNASGVPTFVNRVATAGGPINLVIGGGYLYLLDGVTTGQIHTFSLANPAAPASTATTNFYGAHVLAYNSATTPPSLFALSYSDQYLREYSLGNPAVPTLAGTTAGTTTNYSIAISGNTVYTPANSSVDIFGTTLTPQFNSTIVGAGDFSATGNLGVGANASIYQDLFVGGNITANGTISSGGGLIVDKNNVSAGTTAADLSFGWTGSSATGEGITSRRVSGANQYGLDFQTNYTPRLSVTNGGNVGVNTQTPAATLDVNGTMIERGDLRMILRGGGVGNNGGQGRALVDAGLNQGNVGATGLHINYANDFGQVNIDSDTYVAGKVYANGVALTSDARYKTNVATLDNALENLLGLRGVTYDYDRAKWPAKNFPEGRQIGFIAQEVEQIFPEIVMTDASGYKSVLYQNAVPILIEGMKAQQKQIDRQRREIEALKTDNAELRKQSSRITELEKSLANALAAFKQAQKARETDARK